MRLDEAIVAHLDVAERAALAAGVGTDWSDLPGDSDQDRAAALFTTLGDAGRSADLMAALADARPDIPWAGLPYPAKTLHSLHDRLTRRYDLDGLRDLCFRLGIEYENLRGETRDARARELVLWLDRAGRAGDLWPCAGPEPRAATPPRRAAIPLGARVPFLLPLLLIPLALVWSRHQARLWPVGPPAPAEAVGVAVAEFTETADCRRGPRGREAGELVYESLARELALAAPDGRVVLSRAGRACDAAEAIAQGRRVGADIVLWGWLPQSAEGVVAEFTLIDAPPATADLAGSFAALVVGPGEAASFRLSGRAAALSRFLLGLLFAAEGRPAAAELQFSGAIALLEDGAPADSGRTLAVVYTERGKARDALGRSDDALADYRTAESLDPTYPRLLVTLAGHYYLRREWDAARRYLDRASLLDAPGGGAANVAYGYGLLDYYRGRYESAIAHFDRAIDLSLAAGQHPATAWLARGHAYVKLGDCGAAADSFRAVRAAGDAGSGPTGAAATEMARCGRATATPPATRTGDRPVTPRPTASPTALPAALNPAVEPEPSATPAPTTMPLLEIGPRGANVRQGPGPDYPVVATLRAGARLELRAISPTGEWYQVRLPGKGSPWVDAGHAVVIGEAELPVATAGSRATPTAIAAPPTSVHIAARPPAATPTRTPFPWNVAPPTPTEPAAALPSPTRAPGATSTAPPPGIPTLLPPPTARYSE